VARPYRASNIISNTPSEKSHFLFTVRNFFTIKYWNIKLLISRVVRFVNIAAMTKRIK
jgi:hypothetical protein